MYKIAFFSAHEFDREYFNNHNSLNYEYTYLTCEANEHSIQLAKNHDVVCIFANDKIDHNAVLNLSKLNIKLVALRCAGYNNVDLEAAKMCGITVVRVPAYSPHSVAEHAVAMLLTLNRKLHKTYNKCRDGDFSLQDLLGFSLYQKTIGVVGSGNIGSIFIKIMLGFGCNVQVYDPIINNEIIQLGAKYVSLDTLFSQSDIISLHCPLNQNTLHMINARTLKLMKRGVFIINTGRGGLMDTIAVKNNLLNGKIGHLAMDVYEHESELFFRDLSGTIIRDALISELLMYPNVLITPHQGFFTVEALIAIAKTTTANIEKFFHGEIINQVSI